MAALKRMYPSLVTREKSPLRFKATLANRFDCGKKYLPLLNHDHELPLPSPFKAKILLVPCFEQVCW